MAGNDKLFSGFLKKKEGQEDDKEKSTRRKRPQMATIARPSARRAERPSSASEEPTATQDSAEDSGTGADASAHADYAEIASGMAAQSVKSRHAQSDKDYQYEDDDEFKPKKIEPDDNLDGDNRSSFSRSQKDASQGQTERQLPARSDRYTPVKKEEAAIEEKTFGSEPGARFTFEGQVVSAPDGPLQVTPESRAVCALFDTGLWLVSASHRNSPLVTSVAAQAKRQKFKINEPRFVTPDIIQQAYLYAEKQNVDIAFDDNAIRRKIVYAIAAAAEVGANDIHIQVAGGRTKVEFRQEGLLRQFENWTQREGEMFLAAVWSHSSTQSSATANWSEPQAANLHPEGGIDSITFPDNVMGCRCQWVPLADGGRYLDMRLHYDSSEIFDAEDGQMPDMDVLGFEADQVEVCQQLRDIPGGVRLISGPTGQGKTTTLRFMLNRRMFETKYKLNCLLIEDPPEGGVLSAREIGVAARNNESDRTRIFADIMRASLRLDPDILMLGEVRDLETATFLFRLALTGRQVYSSIHVYSALAIPQRLRDLGIESYLCYDPYLLKGLLAQRLVRNLCHNCRIPLPEAAVMRDDWGHLARRIRAGMAIYEVHSREGYAVPVEQIKFEEPNLDQVFIANPEGCENCIGGRKGRTVISEAIETDTRLMSLLSEDKVDEARDYWTSHDGLAGLPMAWHGMMKIQRGQIASEDYELEFGPMASPKNLRTFEEIMGEPQW